MLPKHITTRKAAWMRSRDHHDVQGALRSARAIAGTSKYMPSAITSKAARETPPQHVPWGRRSTGVKSIHRNIRWFSTCDNVWKLELIEELNLKLHFYSCCSCKTWGWRMLFLRQRFTFCCFSELKQLTLWPQEQWSQCDDGSKEKGERDTAPIKENY